MTTKKVSTSSLMTHRLSRNKNMVNFHYCEHRQYERAKRVNERLQDETLTEWAKEYWKSVLVRLSTNQEQLDFTFKTMLELQKQMKRHG